MSFRVFDDVEALSRAAARAIADAANRVLGKRERFTLALAGGNTPRLLYRLLSGELRDEVPWESVHLFWSDERYVSRDHADSNYRMARETLIDPLSLPSDNVHPPDVELDDADASARGYESSIRSFFAPAEPRFDALLLGLGEDGHIASLLPGSTAVEQRQRLVVAVHDSPKPPPVRLTMTLPLINRAREIHILVSGESKRDALARSRRREEEELPAQRVLSDVTHWWVDRKAAGEDG